MDDEIYFVFKLQIKNVQLMPEIKEMLDLQVVFNLGLTANPHLLVLWCLNIFQD